MCGEELEEEMEEGSVRYSPSLDIRTCRRQDTVNYLDKTTQTWKYLDPLAARHKGEAVNILLFFFGKTLNFRIQFFSRA